MLNFVIGQELALTNSDIGTLQGKYQDVIDSYSVGWIDFDIEGIAITDHASIDRRNQAVRGLQVANPNLIVSYTLPALASGLSSNGIYLLKSAKNAGVRVDGNQYISNNHLYF